MAYTENTDNANEGEKMNRGSKEFYEVKASFEKSVKSGYLGYLPGDFTADNFNSRTFYANGQINSAFLSFMAGYAAAKHEYSTKD